MVSEKSRLEKKRERGDGLIGMPKKKNLPCQCD